MYTCTRNFPTYAKRAFDQRELRSDLVPSGGGAWQGGRSVIASVGARGEGVALCVSRGVR